MVRFDLPREARKSEQLVISWTQNDNGRLVCAVLNRSVWGGGGLMTTTSFCGLFRKLYEELNRLFKLNYMKLILHGRF